MLWICLKASQLQLFLESELHVRSTLSGKGILLPNTCTIPVCSTGYCFTAYSFISKTYLASGPWEDEKNSVILNLNLFDIHVTHKHSLYNSIGDHSGCILPTFA